jgi:hypothetical protein
MERNNIVYRNDETGILKSVSSPMNVPYGLTLC